MNHLWIAFMTSDAVGKAIVILILLLSVFAWAVTFNRWYVFRRARNQSAAYLKMFDDKGGDFSGIYAESARFPHAYHSATFMACYRELRGLAKVENKALVFGREIIAAIENAMSRALADQSLQLQHYLFFLATTTGLAPFMGLLGTVWGILVVFLQMGVTGGQDLGVIAPGISSALLTTIVGLIVAIPALVAYNYFQRVMEIMLTDMENFAKRLSGVLEKNAAMVENSKHEWNPRSVGAV